jgi:hypothetical protein
LHDAAAEARFCTAIAAEMRRHDAPPELYDRFDLGRSP